MLPVSLALRPRTLLLPWAWLRCGRTDRRASCCISSSHYVERAVACTAHHQVGCDMRPDGSEDELSESVCSRLSTVECIRMNTCVLPEHAKVMRSAYIASSCNTWVGWEARRARRGVEDDR
ncbi:hypothetical protein C8Q73DRAFT_155217 [Cubamyces lactineus]|nr:hypothetical protein C8Q73DRAFT_155217 [Cubamyces lactineus]